MISGFDRGFKYFNWFDSGQFWLNELASPRNSPLQMGLGSIISYVPISAFYLDSKGFLSTATQDKIAIFLDQVSFEGFKYLFRHITISYDHFSKICTV